MEKENKITASTTQSGSILLRYSYCPQCRSSNLRSGSLRRDKNEECRSKFSFVNYCQDCRSIVKEYINLADIVIVE